MATKKKAGGTKKGATKAPNPNIGSKVALGKKKAGKKK